MAKKEHKQVIKDGIKDNLALDLLEGSTAIQVIVGPASGSQTWILPENLITHHSSFFTAALNGHFVEAKSKSVSLPESDPHIFRMFVQWLYLGDFRNEIPEDCVKAWLLGDMLGCDTVCDCTMMKIINKFDSIILEPEMVSSIYELSVAGSSLRNWAVEQFFWDQAYGLCSSGEDEWDEAIGSHPDFSCDIAKKLVRHSAGEIKVNPSEDPDRYVKTD